MEDALHGEYEEFKSLRDYVQVDGFEELLVNESWSFLGYMWYTVKHSFFWSAVLFGVIYFLVNRQRNDRKFALIVAGGVIAGLLLIEILGKAREEELI